MLLLAASCLFGCQNPNSPDTHQTPPAEIINPTQTATASKPAQIAATASPATLAASATESVEPTAEATTVSGDSIQPLTPPEDRTRYRLEAQLDYEAHTLRVNEWITYTNRSREALGYLQLVVEAARYPGTFDLQAISDQAGERIFQFHLKDTLLSVGLPKPLLPGESTQIALAYLLRLVKTGSLPQIRPYPLGYTDLQANFGDWYPFTAPFDEQKGWLAHAPAMFGEHLVYEISDYEVAIELVGETTALEIAASAPADRRGDLFNYTQTAARSFSWSASPFYEVLTQTVDLGESGTAIIASYYFPLQAEAGKSLLETMSQALPLYTRLFGAAPSLYLAGVQADFLDGMEYDGLFFLSTDYYNWHKPDTPEDFLTALGAHETAHQWWYRLVGNDQALEPWLDEALCTYSERLFFEHSAPQALDWWWTWRVNYYEPAGWVNMSIYDAPQAAKMWRAYRDPVYLRGALFLEALRDSMGDEAFFAALHEYIQRYAYDLADADGLLEILQTHSEQDLGETFGKYLVKQQ